MMARTPNGTRLQRSALSAGLLLLSAPLLADGEARTAPVLPAAPNLVSLALTLGLVIAMIFAFVWVLKRMGGVRSFGTQQVRVTGGLSLGQRERLVIAEVDGQRLLLGVTSQHITLLRELGEAPAQDAQPRPVSNFAQQLQNAIRGEKTQ